MNAATLRSHLAELDAALTESARLCVYGSAALMLLGEEDRFSADMDIAGPYSVANERALALAAQSIGWPVNPPDDFPGDYIEWVGPARLCLAPPDAASTLVLWQGRRLNLFTVPPADLIASRLIRYDPTDQADIQFLQVQTRVGFEQIAAAVKRLPPAFRDDPVVQDNLANLRRDLERWVA